MIFTSNQPQFKASITEQQKQELTEYIQENIQNDYSISINKDHCKFNGNYSIRLRDLINIVSILDIDDIVYNLNVSHDYDGDLEYQTIFKWKD